MIATHSQEAKKEQVDSVNTSADASFSLLPNRTINHHPKAGLNPLVDAVSYLLSVLGKLKYIKAFRDLHKLQTELIQEIKLFESRAKKQGYNNDYIIVCRYIICATFDDIIANTTWGGQSHWENYSLLLAFNQDPHHQDKFFTILERAMLEPSLYIDLMELMYICLSMGYKGHYRTTEHSQFQLEQIINNLYKHIRAFRGSFTKTLSPPLVKSLKNNRHTQNSPSLLSIFFITACINVTIFVSLGYLMDAISNEAYKNIKQLQNITRSTR